MQKIVKPYVKVSRLPNSPSPPLRLRAYDSLNLYGTLDSPSLNDLSTYYPATLNGMILCYRLMTKLSYGHPWAHYLGGYQDRLLGGPLGLLYLGSTTPVGGKHKDYRGLVLG
jgi:hypothetical protein